MDNLTKKQQAAKEYAYGEQMRPREALWSQNRDDIIREIIIVAREAFIAGIDWEEERVRREIGIELIKKATKKIYENEI